MTSNATVEVEGVPLSDRDPWSRRRIRIALLTASPVHTRTPLYRLVAADPRIALNVIFASNGGLRPVSGGYRDPIRWDVDLLAGYSSTFLRRADHAPIDGHFFSFRDLDIISALGRGRYEVLWLWGYNYFTHQLATLSHFLKGRPVIFHENQTLLDRRPAWKSLIKRSLLPQIFGRGRALYVGRENYRWFRHYGVPAEKLYFAPYAVDNRRFQAEASQLRARKSELQKGLGIQPDSGPVILSVARLIPKKRPLLLLEAFRRVRERQQCSLVFVGSGELEDLLIRRIRDQSIPDVTIAGFVNQSTIGQAYAAADIFVLPSSEKETWGLTVNEAMNFGLPIVVSSAVGCAADLVPDGRTGYVFPSDDAHELANRLDRLVSSESTRKRFGLASLELVSAWNYEAAALGLTRAIADAVGAERWHEASLNLTQELSH